MRAADSAVLEAIESDVLQPAVIEAAIAGALQVLTSAEDLARRQDALQTALSSLESELARLAGAVASGGEIPALMVALRDRELERTRLARELDGVRSRNELTRVDLPRLRVAVSSRLEDWRGLLRRHTPQARQILRKLLKSRLVFQPQTREGCDGFRFTGEGALGRLLSGFLLDAQTVASPEGFVIRVSPGFDGFSGLRAA